MCHIKISVANGKGQKNRTKNRSLPPCPPPPPPLPPSGTEKTSPLKVWSFRDSVIILSAPIWMIAVCFALFPFIPLFVTWIRFQGHRGLRFFNSFSFLPFFLIFLFFFFFFFSFFFWGGGGGVFFFSFFPTVKVADLKRVFIPPSLNWVCKVHTQSHCCRSPKGTLPTLHDDNLGF